MDESWQQLGERLDKNGKRGPYKRRAPRERKPPAPRQPRSQEQKVSRNQQTSAIERNRALEAKERAWEAMMTERIRTESALIRAENLERKRVLESGPGYSQREVKLHSLPESD